MFVSSWGSGRCTYCRVWGAWTQNSMRRVMSVGLGRGHVCIQEALNLEPLYLRLSPRDQVPVTHSSSSSFSLKYQSKDSVSRPSLSLGNLTLRFQVFGPKPPADRTSGDRLWDPGGGHVLLPVLPELYMFGTSFYPLTWTSSLSVHPLSAHLARCSFCCSELQGSHLTRVTVELHQPHIELNGVQL